MATASQQYTYTTGFNVTASVLNNEYGEIYSNLNSITNDQINAAAAIAVSKTEFASGSTTTAYMANNVALTFKASAATASTIKQTTSNDLLVTIGTATKAFNVANSAGTSVAQVNTSTTSINALAGYKFRAFDSSNIYHTSLLHDGANAVLGVQNGNLHIYDADHDIRVRIYDNSGGSNFLDAYTSGSASTIKANGGILEIQAVGDIHLEPGGGDTTNDGTLLPATSAIYSLGDSTHKWTDVWATNGAIQTSDANDKRDIQDTDLGLAFINALRPVSYVWKDFQYTTQTRVIDVTTENLLDEHGEIVLREDGEPATKTVETERIVEEEHTQSHSRSHYGLIAQEVEEALEGKDFAGLIKDEDIGTYGLRYQEFIAPLIKAVQELSARIDILEA